MSDVDIDLNRFVVEYSAIWSNTYCCPNSKHWKWLKSILVKHCSEKGKSITAYNHVRVMSEVMTVEQTRPDL